MSDAEPIYIHDCDHCTFLGTVEFEGREFDLYFCKQGHFVPTVIARGSSQPHDYTSGIQLAKVDPVLGEALARAQERNLVPRDTFLLDD